MLFEAPLLLNHFVPLTASIRVNFDFVLSSKFFEKQSSKCEDKKVAQFVVEPIPLQFQSF